MLFFMGTLSDELAKQLQEEPVKTPVKTARFPGLEMVLALVVGLVVGIVIGGVCAYVLLVPEGYKPVDVSDIPDGQKKLLSKLVSDIKKLPTPSREAFLCEQMGLCFASDGSKVMRRDAGPATDGSRASFIGRSGHPQSFGKAWKASKESFRKCYGVTLQMNQLKEGAVLSFFKEDIDCIVCNTAKYLLKEMPDELRWLLLATLDKKLYYQDGKSASEKMHKYPMECGADFSYYGDWENGYFMGANGEEIKAWKVFSLKAGRFERYRRWCDIVRHCANLVGDKDILALFPDEVKAIRKHCKKRRAQLKKQNS